MKDDSGKTLKTENQETADEVAEGAGGVSGVLAGAAIGSAAGPIGTIIGGIAGAVGGWWAGRAVMETAARYSEHDDSLYREAYEHSPNRFADLSYDMVQPAYQLGHLARRNPDYRGREFDSIEPELRAGWAEQVSSQHGEWSQVREFARDAYTREASVTRREGALRSRNSEENLGDRVVNANREGADRVAGAVDDARAAQRDAQAADRDSAATDIPHSRR